MAASLTDTQRMQDAIRREVQKRLEEVKREAKKEVKKEVERKAAEKPKENLALEFLMGNKPGMSAEQVNREMASQSMMAKGSPANAAQQRAAQEEKDRAEGKKVVKRAEGLELIQQERLRRMREQGKREVTITDKTDNRGQPVRSTKIVETPFEELRDPLGGSGFTVDKKGNPKLAVKDGQPAVPAHLANTERPLSTVSGEEPINLADLYFANQARRQAVSGREAAGSVRRGKSGGGRFRQPREGGRPGSIGAPTVPDGGGVFPGTNMPIPAGARIAKSTPVRPLTDQVIEQVAGQGPTTQSPGEESSLQMGSDALFRTLAPIEAPGGDTVPEDIQRLPAIRQLITDITTNPAATVMDLEKALILRRFVKEAEIGQAISRLEALKADKPGPLGIGLNLLTGGMYGMFAGGGNRQEQQAMTAALQARLGTLNPSFNVPGVATKGAEPPDPAMLAGMDLVHRAVGDTAKFADPQAGTALKNSFGKYLSAGLFQGATGEQLDQLVLEDAATLAQIFKKANGTIDGEKLVKTLDEMGKAVPEAMTQFQTQIGLTDEFGKGLTKENAKAMQGANFWQQAFGQYRSKLRNALDVFQGEEEGEGSRQARTAKGTGVKRTSSPGFDEEVERIARERMAGSGVGNFMQDLFGGVRTGLKTFAQDVIGNAKGSGVDTIRYQRRLREAVNARMAELANEEAQRAEAIRQLQ